MEQEPAKAIDFIVVRNRTFEVSRLPQPGSEGTFSSRPNQPGERQWRWDLKLGIWRQMFYICSQAFLDSQTDMRHSDAQCSMMQHPHLPKLRIIVTAKHRVSVNLAEDEYRELAALSDKHRVSMAWLSRQAIIEFLERYQNEELQLPLRLTPGRSKRHNT